MPLKFKDVKTSQFVTMYDLSNDIDIVKQRKINELKSACTNAIYNGFISAINNYEFGFNSHDQLNFNSQLNKINLWKNQLSDGLITQTDYDAKFPIQWKSKNIGVVSLTELEFITVLDDAEKHLLIQQQKYWQLEGQVYQAITIEEIENVKW